MGGDVRISRSWLDKVGPACVRRVTRGREEVSLRLTLPQGGFKGIILRFMDLFGIQLDLEVTLSVGR